MGSLCWAADVILQGSGNFQDGIRAESEMAIHLQITHAKEANARGYILSRALLLLRASASAHTSNAKTTPAPGMLAYECVVL